MNVLYPPFKTEHMDNIVGTAFLDALILDSNLLESRNAHRRRAKERRLLLVPKRQR